MAVTERRSGDATLKLRNFYQNFLAWSHPANRT